jgi:tripartite-type tricarboxylate transporter receptor subunit TctC
MRAAVAAVVTGIATGIVPGHALAQADAYPAKPVRWIIPFPPGGSVDVVARLVGPKLGEALKQQVVLDNRTGASGNIGTELAARAPADGYTVLSNTLPFVVNPSLLPRVPYDVQKDFEPVMLLATQMSFVGIHPSVPAKNARELVALSRAKPGLLNYATAGAGTNPHIAGELFNLLGKADITAVHFKGGGPAMIAVMGGEVGVTFLGIAGATNHIKANRIRAIGVTGNKRAVAMPEVPTVAESGIPGYEFYTWHVLVAPKNTPRQVVTLLGERLRGVLQAPDIVQRFRTDELDIVAASPEATGTFLADELKKWARVVKERGMKAD